MTRKPKAEQPPKIDARKEVRIAAATDEEARQKYANLVASPELAAMRTIVAVEGQQGFGAKLDWFELSACLREQAKAANGGDLACVEAMLMNQATALQSLFARLTERGIGAEYMNTFEAYMRMALRAQSQCRATLETLAAIKNPPIVYARQANIANGPQQVNNGTHAQEPAIEQTKVLEAQHAERLDTGATATGIRADTAMATLGTLDRPQDRSR